MARSIADFVKHSLFPPQPHCAGPAPSSPGEKKSLWKASLSGGITGGLEACITYPTEYIKTIQQLYPEFSKKGIIGSGKQTVKTNGVRGLYRGLSCLLFFSIPKTGVRFGSKQFFDANIFTTPSKLSTFLSGACAGTCEAIFVVTPMETLKVKLIHDRLLEQPKYSGLFNGINVIYKNQGWIGVYKGPIPTVLRQSSNQAIRFLVYGEVKKWLQNNFTSLPMTATTALAGAVAGGASVLGNTPIDVVKTNLQGLQAERFNGTWDCIQQIARNEGFKGFYKGVGARLSRVVLDVAITFTLFEHIKNLLNKVFP